MVSWEQPLQPYLPPGSLVPADTQNISCHSPAARGSTSFRSRRLCTEHGLVLLHPQLQPLLPGECMMQLQELQEPSKCWGPQGYRTGSPSLCNMGHSQAGSSCHRRLCGDKMPARSEPAQAPQVLCHQPGAKQMPVISNRNTRHTAALALPWGKAITDRLYPLRLTEKCPGSDQVGHAGGGRKPPVSS